MRHMEDEMFRKNKELKDMNKIKDELRATK